MNLNRVLGTVVGTVSGALSGIATVTVPAVVLGVAAAVLDDKEAGLDTTRNILLGGAIVGAGIGATQGLIADYETEETEDKYVVEILDQDGNVVEYADLKRVD